MKEGVEVTLSQPRTNPEIQPNSEEITKNKQPEQEKSFKTLYTRKNQLQHNLPTPAQQKTRVGGQADPQIISWWERPTKERLKKTQKPKTYTEST